MRDQILTLPEAASQLDRSVQTLYNWRDSGVLEMVTQAGRVGVMQSEVDRLNQIVGHTRRKTL